MGKAAIARDLFGKQGPAFLATLKDIAESQDVVGTTTAKMAADAEALEKAWRRLTVEGTAFKDLILSGLVPWLNTMLEQFREGIKLAGGFGEALRTLGTINPFKSAAENIADANERLAALKAGTGAESFFAKMFGTTDEVNRRLELVKAFEQLRQRQQAMAGAAALGYTGDVRDYVAGRKPTLDYTGTKSKGAGAGKAEVDEFAKAMQRVREMAAAAGDAYREAFSGDKILPAVKALDKLEDSDVWRKLNAGQREAIVNSYAQRLAALEKADRGGAEKARGARKANQGLPGDPGGPGARPRTNSPHTIGPLCRSKRRPRSERSACSARTTQHGRSSPPRSNTKAAEAGARRRRREGNRDPEDSNMTSGRS